MSLRIAIVLLAAVALAACAAPVEPDPGFAMRTTPASPSPDGARTAPAQSLGSPFVVTATTLPGEPRSAPLAVHDAWLLLSSDACDVFLDSLELAMVNETEAPAFYATRGRTPGVVVASSPHAVRVLFDVSLQPTRLGTPDATPIEAVVSIDARELDGRVVIDATVEAPELGDRRFDFAVAGSFSEDPSAVPAHRTDCPY